ncbi:MAG TPA: phosphate ABC transporter substrate-binding protein [Acidiferrobacterales bacterium]|nr:phosphate ABC transporter substrate-binding protein [Acidiferrobacterales bacterium]
MKIVPRVLLATGASTLLLLANMPSSMAATPSDNKKLSWAGCGVSKAAFMSEMAVAYEKKTGVKIDLIGGGATKGIRQVSSKATTIGGTCRHVIEKDGSMMTHPEERRVQLTPVAWDALVVITHKDNPVDTISSEQLRKLYKGQITNWKELGGKDAPIELYARKGKVSGVGRTLRELLFYNYEEEFAATHVVDSSGPLERAMEKNPSGVGVTGVSSARKLVKNKTAKILKLDGKESSYENIRTGQYVLYRPLYVVTNLQEKNPEVKKFVQFVSSDEGKAIMRNVGTVPYEDAVGLWLTYLDQQNKAMANRLHIAEPAGSKAKIAKK